MGVADLDYQSGLKLVQGCFCVSALLQKQRLHTCK